MVERIIDATRNMFWAVVREREERRQLRLALKRAQRAVAQGDLLPIEQKLRAELVREQQKREAQFETALRRAKERTLATRRGIPLAD